MSVPFLRTPSGLTNGSIFAGVDAIMYVEGSSHYYTIEEIVAGAGDSNTLDVAFWSKLIRLIHPQKEVQVRSVGNKETVKAVAALLASGAVSRVVVALDRDFDDRKNSLVQHPNVLYTYGYSWENDVFCHEVLADMVDDLAPPQGVLVTIKNELKRAAEELRRCFQKLVRLDHSLAQSGNEVTRRGELEKSIRLHDRPPRSSFAK